MNCKQINNISFQDILGKLGNKPTKINNKEIWYKSPFRDEKTASFKINIESNIFYDFGEGIGGTVIDFWCRLKNRDVKTAIEQISNLFSFQEQEQQKRISSSDVIAEVSQRYQIEILDVKPITNPVLKTYLSERGLSERVYSHISEVSFDLKGNYNYAIGFQNDKGGFELRNKIFKGCSSKAITSIINKRSRTLCIFEGWADYLSYLEMTTSNKNKIIREHNTGFNESILVLNSLAMKEQAIPYITQFEKVKLFLDNDNAGKKLASDLKASFSNIKDCSDTYSKFKDLNDYYIDQMRVHQETKNAINKLKL